MFEELKKLLKNMEPKRNLKWFWIKYIRNIKPEKELSYMYFSNMTNELCAAWPEVTATVQKFINENK